MKVSILQPGYLPWLGFFDLMSKSDIFVILDDVQFTKNDWRNRNRIKTDNGIQWLTIPVIHEFGQIIKDTAIDNNSLWQKKHLRALKTWYGKSRFFKNYIEEMEKIYSKNFKYLIDVDMDFILKAKEFLSLETNIVLSSEIPSAGKRDEKVLSICKHLNATHYLTGDAAKAYLREPIFNAERISVEWHNYHPPYYNQLWLKKQGFISHLSIIDLLFNCGTDSHAVITGKKVIPQPENIRVRQADEA
ncbi:MAG: WbqC family protein [Nitrospirae bacterium]|nr:WbqC family protein [Nitrospirota bacterium]